MKEYRLRVAQRGRITLPTTLRRAYGIEPGQPLMLSDLGGTFLLHREPSEMDTLADRIAAELAGRGETLESMLAALCEESGE